MLGLPLAGCGGDGFKPLYATGPSGEGVHSRLAAVDISTIPGRVGQRIRNELVFERSSAPEAAPTKRLEVVLTESVLTTLVKIDGNSTGQVYQVEANFRLIDLASKKVEFQGRSLGRTSFDRFESVYANVRAREDSENRAAQLIAKDIRLRLAAHMSRG
jgi:LPS-assembly lipoprotein